MNSAIFRNESTGQPVRLVGRRRPHLYRNPRDPAKDGDLGFCYAESLRQAYRRRRQFDEVGAFCLFIGYPRSGHSLVGSLVDAHPDIVIAHEFDALGYVDAGFRRQQIYSLILDNDRDFSASGRQWYGYRYAVANQWQGRVRNLKVIGDKKGGVSTLRLRENPGLLNALRRVVNVPLRVIHVIRNPFDNIATLFTRQAFATLHECVDFYFSLLQTNESISRTLDAGELFAFRHEELIQDSIAVVGSLCGFLGVDPDESYLESCRAAVWSAPNYTRQQITWPDALRREIECRISEVPLLAGYSFEI